MIRAPVKVKIGANEYIIRKMEPFVALRLFGDLQRRVLGPAAGLIAAFTKGESTDVEADNKALTVGIEALSKAMAGPDLEYVANLLINKEYIAVITKAEPDGIKCDVKVADQVMDDMFEIVELCKEIATVNWQDFGMRVRGLFGRAA